MGALLPTRKCTGSAAAQRRRNQPPGLLQTRLLQTGLLQIKGRHRQAQRGNSIQSPARFSSSAEYLFNNPTSFAAAGGIRRLFETMSRFFSLLP